jgi:tetratricopeptide (TPR) repeat protein
MNPDVKSRYFARVDFSPTTSADYFPVKKPEGSFRIFCLGGSTTVGFPYGYAGSFPFLLRQRLQRIFPERNIEVINLGMTATNSFTALDLAAELPEYEPDLILVYDGHNEFYGALGVASRESVGQARWLTRLYLRAIHSRVFLALRDLYTRLRGTSSREADAPGGTMMERLARGQDIEYESSTYLRALGIFRENTMEMAELSQRHRIPILLGSQVSNLRDLRPFISRHSADIPSDRMQAFSVAFERGQAGRHARRPEAALSAFREALLIDSSYAGLHFEIACSLDSLGMRDDALTHYVKARDLDCLRFRASQDFNRVILSCANPPGVIAVDMEHWFAQESQTGIVGSDLILEHVHPNERGYFILARAYCRAMREAGLLATAKEWERRDTISETTHWNDTRLTELDARAASRRIAMLTSGWPFKNSSSQPPGSSSTDEIGQIVDRLTGAMISWEEAHVAAAEVYRRNNDYHGLEREYRTLIRVLPVNVSAYLLLGDLYMRTGNAASAGTILRQSLDVERTHYALNSLGALALEEGRADTALSYLQDALALAPDAKSRLQSGFLLARAHHMSGNIPAARERLQNVLSESPGFQPAEQLLKQLEGLP